MGVKENCRVVSVLYSGFLAAVGKYTFCKFGEFSEAASLVSRDVEDGACLGSGNN